MSLGTGIVAVATATHSAPHHDTLRLGASVWEAWSFDPVVLLAAAVAALCFARGLRRWPNVGRANATSRAVSYYVGLVTVVLALLSPIDGLGSHHLTAHMVQHLMLTTAVPLLLLGSPVVPILRGLPRRWAARAIALARTRGATAVWSLVRRPDVAFILYGVTLAAWHVIPGWYDAALRNDEVHYLEHASLVAGAFPFWHNIIGAAGRRPLGYLARIPYVLSQGALQTGIGVYIALADHPLYAAYATTWPVFPLTPLEDQQLGGVVMLVYGELADILVASVLFALWWAALARAEEANEAAER